MNKNEFRQNEKNSKINNLIFFILGTCYYISSYSLNTTFNMFIINQIRFLTNWGHFMCYSYSILRLFNFNGIKTKKYFNLVFNYSCFVCLFFWGGIYNKEMIEKDNYQTILTVIIYNHIYPLIFVIAEYFIKKDFNFEYGNFKHVLYIYVLYFIINFYFSVLTHDKSLLPYKLIDYKSMVTVYFLIAAFLFIGIIHFSFTFYKKKIIKIN